MHFTFREAIADRADVETWQLSSRGTHLGHDERICEVAERMLSSRPRAEEFAHLHRSRGLSATFLKEQDLAVVATRQERGRLAKLSPADRARVFTLREATLLGAAPPSPAELDRARAFVSVEWNRLGRAYAWMLSDRRGLVPTPPGDWAARGLLRSPKSDPLDIPDGHHRGYLKHTMTLRRVQAEAEVLANQMVRFVDALA